MFSSRSLRPLATLSLPLLALLANACIGDPNQISYCEGNTCVNDVIEGPGDTGTDSEDEDAPGPSDSGDANGSGDANDADSGGDTGPEPPESCIVSKETNPDTGNDEESNSYSSIRAAYDADCPIIYIDHFDDDSPAQLYDDSNQPSELEPLKILREVTIQASPPDDPAGSMDPDDSTARAKIQVPTTGLFTIEDNGSLTLNNIEFLPPSTEEGVQPSMSAHAIALSENSKLAGSNISFSDFVLGDEAAILYLKGDAIFEKLSINSSQNSADFGLLHITNGAQVEIINGEIKENLDLKSAAIYLNQATLTIDDSSIIKNEIIDQGPIVFGAGVHCNDSTLHINETFISDNKIEVSERAASIKILGAGAFLTHCRLQINSSQIDENQLVLKNIDQRESDSIQVEGAGLYLSNSSILAQDLRAENNSINLELSKDYTEGKHPAGGAGVIIKNESESATFERATFYKNSIHATENGKRDIKAIGGGLAFINKDQARLEMVNSTIGDNSILGPKNAHGTGLYLSGPGFEKKSTSNCVFLGLICRNDGNDAPQKNLLAILRYTTIAYNKGENQNGDPAFEAFYVEKTGDENAEMGPPVSLIGLALQNAITNAFNNHKHNDCGGDATVIPIGDGNETVVDDIQLGSAYNYASDETSRNLCRNSFKSDDVSKSYFRGFPLDLQKSDPDDPPILYIPDYGLRISPESPPCSGLRTNEPLAKDQRGEPRPGDGDSGICYPGSVQPQPSD